MTRIFFLRSGRQRIGAGFVVGLLALGLGWGAYQLGNEQPSNPLEATSRTSEQDAVALALRAGKPTVVEFGANSCAACREMKPVLAALARDHGARITVADIDIVKEREYIRRYQIRLMPTQVFYDARGQEIGRNMGKISGEEILTRLGVEAAR